MKFNRALILGLAIAAIAPVLGSAAPKNETFYVNYDRFKDTTLIHSKEIQVNRTLFGGYGIGTFLQFAYSCAGNTSRCHPDFITFIFRTNFSSDGWYYINSHDVTFIADEVRIAPISEAKWDGRVGSDVELVSADISTKDFLKLANSHKVEGQVGATEFRISEKDLPKWRVLALEIQ